MAEARGLRGLRNPAVIAAFGGWNDAGEAASGVIDHLVDAYSAELAFAIDPEEFYDFQVNRPTTRLVDGERIVAMLPGTGIREATDAFLAGARGAPPPVVALEVASPAAVLRLVRAGMGVGLVASLAAAGAPGVRVHRLAPGEFRSRLDLVWSSNESPAAVALRDHVRRAVPGASP